MSRPWPKKPEIARSASWRGWGRWNIPLTEWWVFWDMPSKTIPRCSISSPAPPKSHPKPGDSWASHTAFLHCTVQPFPSLREFYFLFFPQLKTGEQESKSMWSMASRLKICKFMLLGPCCIKRSPKRLWSLTWLPQHIPRATVSPLVLHSSQWHTQWTAKCSAFGSSVTCVHCPHFP